MPPWKHSKQTHVLSRPHLPHSLRCRSSVAFPTLSWCSQQHCSSKVTTTKLCGGGVAKECLIIALRSTSSPKPFVFGSGGGHESWTWHLESRLQALESRVQMNTRHKHTETCSDNVISSCKHPLSSSQLQLDKQSWKSETQKFCDHCCRAAYQSQFLLETEWWEVMCFHFPIVSVSGARWVAALSWLWAHPEPNHVHTCYVAQRLWYGVARMGWRESLFWWYNQWKRMHSKMRLHTLASCLRALAHARSSLSHDSEDNGNLATSSRGCVTAFWLEIDALVVTVPGFSIEGRFVHPACHFLQKPQQACVVSDKPGGKVAMTNALPPQDEHSLAHGWWPFCARAIVWLCVAEGGLWQQGFGQICPRGCMGCPLAAINRKWGGFAFTSSLFMVLGKGRMSPRKLGKLGSGNLPACKPQWFWGGLPIPYGIHIAIGASESILYRDCIVNRNSISDFRPETSAAKPLCKNSVSDFGVSYGTVRAVPGIRTSGSEGERGSMRMAGAWSCVGLLEGKAPPHNERPRSWTHVMTPPLPMLPSWLCPSAVWVVHLQRLCVSHSQSHPATSSCRLSKMLMDTKLGRGMRRSTRHRHCRMDTWSLSNS